MDRIHEPDGPAVDGYSKSPFSPHQVCHLCANLALRLHSIYHPLDHSTYMACANCYVAVASITNGYCPTCNE